ncbi:MAG: Bax inhibitor-1/YccA family protein [Treponema sp.]|nr:Bax inhibitor-1/YccA family protein [Treponema sp.]
MPVSTTALTKKEKIALEARRFITRVYAWMAVALVLSAASAFFAAITPAVYNFLWSGRHIGFYVLVAVEILLVVILSATLQKMPVGFAGFLFVLYSIVNGMTLSAIFLVFEIKSIYIVFLISAGMFFAMSLYGRYTKQDLNSAGRYLMMAVFGLVILAVVNLLLKSSILQWIISLVTLVVFIGLTAYDTNKIVRASELADGSDVFKKAAIYGALELYLDFLNIFLSLLNLFGKKR